MVGKSHHLAAFSAIFQTKHLFFVCQSQLALSLLTKVHELQANFFQ
jgi:hypothetical protein